MNDYLIGQIILVPYDYEPVGWLPCDGRRLSAKENSALFSIIGYAFGGQDDSFYLPDLKDRLPIGANKDYPRGTSDGYEAAYLELENLPPHNHKSVLKVSASNGNKSKPQDGDAISVVGVQSGRAFTTQNAFTPASPDTQLDVSSIVSSVVGRDDFDRENISVAQPVLATHFIICVDGIYSTKS